MENSQHTVIIDDISYEDKKVFDTSSISIKAIAFHLPQFYAFPENDLWWGKGFTEWTNVQRAKPLFRGHLQPEIPHPDIGYYDLSNISALQKQIDMAKEFGLYGFCFHHYYFAGKRLMQKPVDMLLEKKELAIPFCLNWANETWSRRWTGRGDEVLIAQEYSHEYDYSFMEDMLKYFADHRYIRVNNRPLFLLHHTKDIPDIVSTIKRWHEVCSSHKEENPYIVMVQTYENKDYKEYGEGLFDAIVQFPPFGKYHRGATDGFAIPEKTKLFSYFECINKAKQEWKSDQYIFPTIIPAWDNSPRVADRATIFMGANPTSYKQWLSDACDYVQHRFRQEEQFVFINAWNEWGEGAHLEPSVNLGYAHLNATCLALGGKIR